MGLGCAYKSAAWARPVVSGGKRDRGAALLDPISPGGGQGTAWAAKIAPPPRSHQSGGTAAEPCCSISSPPPAAPHQPGGRGSRAAGADMEGRVDPRTFARGPSSAMPPPPNPPSGRAGEMDGLAGADGLCVTIVAQHMVPPTLAHLASWRRPHASCVCNTPRDERCWGAAAAGLPTVCATNPGARAVGEAATANAGRNLRRYKGVSCCQAPLRLR